MSFTLSARQLYTPLQKVEYPLVVIEDGKIVALGSRESRELRGGDRLIDLGEAILVPGFVDVHIHGGAGHDVMEAGADALAALERFLFRHGVTSYFPTTVTAPVDQTLVALDRLARSIETSAVAHEPRRARPLGIHLEGPFLSHVRRGVHPPESLLPPTLEMFERFWQAASGHIKLMTIAPELEGAREVIAEAARRGVCVSVGHSDAGLQATRDAVAAGARHATHTFNAMRPLGHRDPGILGQVLTDARLTAEVIADGVHVDPVVVELFLRLKGAEGAVLVTDATAATGMPDGRYRLGSLEVEVREGKCMAGGKLAGSVLTLDRAVRNVMGFAHCDLQQAVRLATLNPARLTGMQASRGQLAEGSLADIVALNSRGEVQKTIAGGQME
jgi:N-acetylglucosamine-6-phosphate deacetylase